MKQREIVALGFAVAALAAASVPGSASAGLNVGSARAASRLVATVGPGFTITLTTTGGSAVKRLTPGSYEVVVRDRSPIHNFDLFGPGIRRKTDVAKTGTTTWRVTLKPGLYRFQCDPHKQFMKGSFAVS